MQNNRVLKKFVQNYGYVFTYTDYVNIFPEGDSQTFYISEKPQEDFNKRVTIFQIVDDKIIISSSVGYHSDNNLSRRLFNISLSKIKKLRDYGYDIPANLKGVTWLSPESLDSVSFAASPGINTIHIDNIYYSQDYFYYHNIFGPIPSDILSIARTQLLKKERLRIKSEKKEMFARARR